MKLIYITTKTFPASTADHVYVQKMAEAYAAVLGNSFTFVVNNDNSNNLQKVTQVHRLQLRPSLRSIRFFFVFPSLYRKLKTQERTVWMSNDTYLLLTLLFYKLFFTRMEVCSDWHVLKDSLLYRLTARGSTFCLCVTSYLRKTLIEKFSVDPKRIFVSPNGIDLSVFDKKDTKESARGKLQLPSNKILLGYFGRFKTMGMDKGIADILQALAKLDDSFIFFAAGGYEKDIRYYQKLADEAGVSGRVFLRGESTQDELALYQKACDILLMPFPFNEHYAYHMSPMKMFEYMASERPIISSDLPSVRDVLNEKNALFVAPDNPLQLATAIEKLSSDKALSQKLAIQARQDVNDRTWDHKASAIVAFLEGKL